MFFRVVLLILISLQVQAQVPNTLIPYRVGDKWGYSDYKGKLVIPAIYSEVSEFSPLGYAIVTLKDTKSVKRDLLLDRLGRKVVHGEFSYIVEAISYHDVMFDLYLNFQFENPQIGELDSSYQRVLKYQVNKFVKGKTYIMMDTSGNTRLFSVESKKYITKPYKDIEYVGIFNDSAFFKFSSDNVRWGVMDEKGKELTAQIYTSIFIDVNQAFQCSDTFLADYSIKRLWEPNEGFYIRQGYDNRFKHGYNPNYPRYKYYTPYGPLPYDSMFYINFLEGFMGRVNDKWAFFIFTQDSLRQISPYKYKYTNGCACLNDNCTKYACTVPGKNGWELIDERDSLIMKLGDTCCYHLYQLKDLGVVTQYSLATNQRNIKYDALYFTGKSKLKMPGLGCWEPSVIDKIYYNGKLTGDKAFEIEKSTELYCYVNKKGFKYYREK